MATKQKVIIAQYISFNLNRYTTKKEQRYRRQFENEFDFFSFNKPLSKPWIGVRNAISFDPSFIHKAGKQGP